MGRRSRNAHGRSAGARVVLVGAVVVLSAMASAVPAVSAQDGKIRGMTVSTPRGSAEWGRDSIVPAFAELKSLGSNWVSIHPYARIDRNGEVRWRRQDGDSDQAPEWLRRPIEEAHRQGLKIFVKPHLAHWGSYSWRGEIAYEDPEARERFFRTYRQWISTMARFSSGADAFAVGTELDGTIEHEDEWRATIAAVRAEFDGPLTYAANWTDYERIPFWDALDAIGIQAYFPLLDRSRVGERLPPQSEFDAGWRSIMARMREFSERHDKIVVFTELGYNLSSKAPYEPWDYEAKGGRYAAELQERCMRAALSAIAMEPSVVGAFLWKWFPGEREPRDFAMSSPAMRRVISEHWLPSAEPDR